MGTKLEWHGNAIKCKQTQRNTTVFSARFMYDFELVRRMMYVCVCVYASFSPESNVCWRECCNGPYSLSADCFQCEWERLLQFTRHFPMHISMINISSMGSLRQLHCYSSHITFTRSWFNYFVFCLNFPFLWSEPTVLHCIAPTTSKSDLAHNFQSFINWHIHYLPEALRNGSQISNLDTWTVTYTLWVRVINSLRHRERSSKGENIFFLVIQMWFKVWRRIFTGNGCSSTPTHMRSWKVTQRKNSNQILRKNWTNLSPQH